MIKESKKAVEFMKRMPRAIEGAPWVAASKSHCEAFVRNLKKDVRSKALRLTPLARSTVLEKIRVGSRTPTVPLVRFGTLVNSVKVVRRGKGYRAEPTGRHPDADMTNKALWMIHENGGGRVPARPVWRKSVRKYLKSQEAKVKTKEFKKAIARRLRA